MNPRYRRALLALGVALATGAVLGTAGANTEREGRSTVDGTVDGSQERDDVELSVSAPESATYREIADPIEDAAEFVITADNTGEEAVSVTATLEIGDVDEPVLLEADGGDSDTVRLGALPRELGVGDHEWTVTADGRTERGTLTVTDGER